MMAELTEEEYDKLDRFYSRKLELFEEKREEYSRLEYVIRGNRTFHGRAVNLDRRFFNSMRHRWLLDSEFGFWLFSDIQSFHSMVTDIYSVNIPFANELMKNVLTKQTKMRNDYWPGFSDTLHQLSVCSRNLDQLVGETYIHEIVCENQDRFHEIYADMTPKGREYAKRKLYHMLEFGILELDEATLSKRLERE